MDQTQNKGNTEDYSLQAWRRKHREKSLYFVRMPKQDGDAEPHFTSQPTSSVEGAEQVQETNEKR